MSELVVASGLVACWPSDPPQATRTRAAPNMTASRLSIPNLLAEHPPATGLGTPVEPQASRPHTVARPCIAEVLFNIDALDINAEDRRKLRIVAFVQDTFKGEVNRASSRTSDNHHAVIARRFVEKYPNDLDILEITELHDEAYYARRSGARRGDWNRARRRA